MNNTKKHMIIIIKIALIAIGVIVLLGLVLGYFITKPSKPSVLTGNVITVQGTYVSKVLSIILNGRSFYLIKTEDGREIKVIIGEGYKNTTSSCLHAPISPDIRTGDLLEVRGAETTEGDILLCGSKDYYVRVVGDDKDSMGATGVVEDRMFQERVKGI